MFVKMETWRGLSAFKKLEESWRRLEARGDATFFQSWDWCDAWLAHYGRAVEPFIITARRDKNISAIAPMVKSKSWLGLPIRRLMFIGTGPSDYGGFLLEPDDKQASSLIAAMADADVDLLDLHQIDEPTVTLVKEALTEKFDVLVLEQEPTLFVELPATFESYLSLLSKKFRKNTVYADRRLRREFDYEERHYKKKDEIREAMTLFFQLHQDRWRKKRLTGLFLGRRNREFHDDLSGRLGSTDRLILSVSYINGEPAAAFYGFQHGQRYAYYLGGFDPALAKYSVSSVLIYNLLKEASSKGIEVFDFLRGREPYKLRWGAQEKPLYRVIIYRSNWRGLTGAKLAKKQNQIVQRTRARLHS